MPRVLAALAAVLAVGLLALACGDDDNGPSVTVRSPATTGTATLSPTETPFEGKTPIAETPGSETPTPTSTGLRPTPAAEGTPAPFISDPATFFATKYPGKSFSETNCEFSPVTVQVTCDGTKYAVDPPPSGQDISCLQLAVDGKPVAIHCSIKEPLQSIYYEIEG